MTKKVNSNFSEFKSAMLSAICCVKEDILLGIADDEFNMMNLSRIEKPSEDEKKSLSAKIVIWKVMLSHLQDMEGDLKDNVRIGSHNYTYGYDLLGGKDAKEGK